MSYNATTFKLKKLENFVIPVKELYPEGISNWHPQQPTVTDVVKNEVTIHGLGEGYVKGILKNGKLNVTDISITGEGSGSFMHYVLNDAFKKTKGTLEAVMIWEGGDDVTKLSVVNGKLKEEKYDL